MPVSQGDGSRLDSHLPRFVQATGLVIFVGHLLSFAVYEGVTVRRVGSPDFLIGAVTTWPFLVAMVYGGRWIQRTDLPAEYYGRLRSWFLGGLVGFLALNLLMIATWPAGSAYDNVAWALFAASVGGTVGLGVGLFEARRIRQAVRADRQRQRRQQTEARNERLADFAESVAHDLRNPLNVAAGNLELARRDPKAEYFNSVEAAHERMANLIDQSLQLARSGRDIDDAEPIDLASFAERCWSNVPTEGARLEVEGSTTVEAGPERLKQLFENLFRNSIEHASSTATTDDVLYRGAASADSHDQSDSSGDVSDDEALDDGSGVTVFVGTLADDEGFYVADDGPGIAVEDRDSVFDSGVSSHDDGSGLGLAIVRRIAEAHGWRVAVDESDAGGARFEFRTDRAE